MQANYKNCRNCSKCFRDSSVGVGECNNDQITEEEIENYFNTTWNTDNNCPHFKELKITDYEPSLYSTSEWF
jgi:hypothetical protein